MTGVQTCALPIFLFDCGISATSAAALLTLALFQDATADAIQVSSHAFGNANYDSFARLTHIMTSGTTSATTFKIRYGSNSVTAYMNQSNAGAKYSTANSAVFTIYEIGA